MMNATLSIPRRSRPEPAPLSFAQTRMWFFAQLEPGSTAYHSIRVFRWSGSLRPDVLERSLAEVVRRHEVLRTRFVVHDGSAAQEVIDEPPVRLPVHDLRGRALHEREPEAREWVARESAKVFDLTRGPLLRAALLRLDDQEHWLVLIAHHIVSDGWSTGVLLRELVELYAAFAAGRESPLPDLPVQYADFAAWQRERLQGELLEGELAYWARQLRGAPALLELPLDHPRPPKQTHAGGQVSFALPGDLAEALGALSRRHRVTPFMTLLAGFAAMLRRHTGQAELVVGTPIAGRIRTELEGLVGCFANTLILRLDCSGDPSFAQLLERARQVALGAYAHQELPFEKLVEDFKPERSLSYHPLFQVMFNYRSFSRRAPEVPGLRVEDVEVERHTSLVDLSLNVTATDDGFACRLFYNSDLFERATIERLAAHYRVLLAAAIADPALRLSRLPLLTEAERRQQLVEWNATAVRRPGERCIHEVVEEHARLTPDAVAVAFRQQCLTYAELNQRANGLSRMMIERGIGRSSFVPILMDRGVEVPVAMLAAMKAGAAFVPLDPEWPTERLAEALDELNSALILTDRSAARQDALQGRPVVLVDATADQGFEPNPGIRVDPSAPIYAIYTSGSTGSPKAAVVPHRGIGNRFQWMNEFFGPETATAALQTTRHVYDSAVWQLFWPLTNGGKTVIPAHGDELSADSLAGLIADHGVTITDFVPSVFNTLVPQLVTDPDTHRALLSLRTIIVGGEEITPATTYSFMARYPGVRVVNLYGPTEASIGCICYEVTGREGGRIPIGRPISNVQVAVLDGEGNPVPIGVAGELYLSGACLGLGYLKDQARTDAVFIDNCLHEIPHAKLYRTGDLVRYLPDGNLEFLGRVDRQVKVRGHRIELGEIESMLAQHARVRDAVVMVHGDETEDRQLVAYVVPATGSSPAEAELLGHLRHRLPEYMLPTAIVPLDALPVLPNGKVNRRALPVPGRGAQGRHAAYVPPRTAVEKTVAEIWTAVLRVERVGVDDDFFRLGGHSLRATQVVARINRTFNLDLPLRTLFEHPTVAGLSARVHEARLAARKAQAASEALVAEVENLSDEEVERLLAAEPEDGFRWAAS